MLYRIVFVYTEHFSVYNRNLFPLLLSCSIKIDRCDSFFVFLGFFSIIFSFIFFCSAFWQQHNCSPSLYCSSSVCFENFIAVFFLQMGKKNFIAQKQRNCRQQNGEKKFFLNSQLCIVFSNPNHCHHLFSLLSACSWYPSPFALFS